MPFGILFDCLYCWPQILDGGELVVCGHRKIKQRVYRVVASYKAQGRYKGGGNWSFKTADSAFFIELGPRFYLCYLLLSVRGEECSVVGISCMMLYVLYVM